MPATLERTTSIADFRARIGEYAEVVASGESLVVTRYNKPIFRVLPVSASGRKPVGRGILAKYADVTRIPLEDGAWARDVEERDRDHM